MINCSPVSTIFTWPCVRAQMVHMCCSIFFSKGRTHSDTRYPAASGLKVPLWVVAGRGNWPAGACSIHMNSNQTPFCILVQLPLACVRVGQCSGQWETGEEHTLQQLAQEYDWNRMRRVLLVSEFTSYFDPIHFQAKLRNKFHSARDRLRRRPRTPRPGLQVKWVELGWAQTKFINVAQSKISHPMGNSQAAEFSTKSWLQNTLHTHKARHRDTSRRDLASRCVF